MCWMIISCLTSIFSSIANRTGNGQARGGGWGSGNGAPACSTTRVACSPVMSPLQIRADCNNQEVLNQFQIKMSEYLASKGKGVSVSTMYNPAQPNLEVIVLQNGIPRGQTFASQPELQSGGYGKIVKQVYKLMWGRLPINHEGFLWNLVKGIFWKYW